MSDQMPHAETIEYRVRDLGWTEQQARETPIRKISRPEGGVNIAEYARALDATPSLVQRFVRAGYALDDAVELAWIAESKS